MLLFVCCGIFTTDTPEDPVGDRDIDPLDFKSILKGGVEQFYFEDYNDLFYEDFVYVDPDNIEYAKTRFQSRLEAIEAKYTDTMTNDTTIEEVLWIYADSNASDPDWFDKEKEISLQTRDYFVILIDSQHVTDTAFTGEANFKLRYDKIREEWEISYWRDIPLGGVARSFFHPDFSQ